MQEITKKYLKNRKALLVMLCVGIAFLFMQKAQAIDVGLNYGDALGLGTNDPIVITLNIIRLVLGLLALIAVILILYSGFLYMTSGGNETQVEKAKKVIKNAVIGLVIVLASFGIVSFIIGKMLQITGAGGNPSLPPWQDPRKIRALGNGIVKSVYPEPDQRDVPMNTSIVVTFKEKIKADTICANVSGGLCDPGSPLLKDNVRIYKTVHSADCSGASACVYEETATVMSNDNETFVFHPDSLLGSVSEDDIEYSVFLTRAIKKEDGKDAFRPLEDGFLWNFHVTNVMDLTPPQVVQYKMFPPPDNARDDLGIVSNAVQASGIIKVTSQPQKYAAAEFVSISNIGSAAPAHITIDNHCPESGVLQVVIDVDAKTAKLIRKSDSISLGSTRTSGDNVNFPGYFKLILNNSADIFDAGNTWEVTVKKEVDPGTLMVDNIVYSFSSTGGAFKIVPGAKLVLTAESIEKAINGTDTFNTPHPKVTATQSGDTVTVTAITGGKLGNNIPLSTNDTGAFTITAMAGGKDREVKTTVKGGSPDKPRNSVIQVNFNESINPITVSGLSSQVYQGIRIVNADGTKAAGDPCTGSSECNSFKCDTGACVGDYLSGKFLISNQYRTVEFLSDNECGINACGEKIYCLPENGHVRVELSAATLADCGADNCASKSPYNTCGPSICQDSGGNNYPMAKAAPLDGVIDMALNSLDGNRSTFSDGPQSQSGHAAFNENSPIIADGDDYQWSFFINDIIDISSPIIEAIKQTYNTTVNEIAPDDSGIYVVPPLNIEFDKLMMSYTLSSGKVSFMDPFTKATSTHFLINLWAHNDNYAAGYWITKSDKDWSIPADKYPDKTTADLNHTRFGKDVTFRTQDGSGIKDIYQNCYNPSSRSGAAPCNGLPSCCDGTPVVGSICP
jgi:hypothetical protein